MNITTQAVHPSSVLKTKQCSLHLGDAYALLKNIPDKSVDVILTDPPYNLRRGNEGRDRDKVPFDPARLVDDFKRVLKPGGNIFAFCSFYKIAQRYQSFNGAFDTMQYMVWHKTDPKRCRSRTTFVSSCEFIMCLRNRPHKRNFSNQQTMQNFFESKRCRGEERVKKKNGKAFHPTQKPVKLLEHLIRISSNPGDIILDPFMGLGSTAVASLNLGRKCIGFEKNEVYAMVARDRIKKGAE